MKTITFILAVVYSQLSIASSINGTKITALLTGEEYGDVAFLKISIKPTDAPSCQTNSIYNYAFDPTTEIGKVTLSMALSAYASGKEVYLAGGNNCGLSTFGVESLRQIRVQ